MKFCSACARDLPLSDFGFNRSTPDGLMYSCRACRREERRAWRKTEKGRAALRRWNASPKAKAVLARTYRKHRERRRAQSHAWDITPEGRASRKAAVVRWAQANPEKLSAQRLARAAIPLTGVCSKCNVEGRTDRHHHNGYDHPLDVVELCRACHQAEHRERKAS